MVREVKFIEKNNDNYEYILADGKLLTSKFSLDNEEKRLFNKIFKKKNHTIFILGIGLGRYIETIESNIDDFVSVIIYEPNKSIYKKFINSKYYLKNSSIHYISCEKEDLEREFKKIKNVSRHVVHAIYGNYISFYSKEYYFALKAIKERVHIFFTNEITINFFSRKFTKNLVENLTQGKFNGEIGQFNNFFNKIPALVVSSGPSLDKNFKYIKDFKGIIFTGGRTLKLLKESGIENVIFASIDPGENAYSLVEESIEEEFNYPFFSLFESNHNIIKKYKGPKIAMQSYNIDLYSEGIVEKAIPRIDVGGSIGNAAVSIAEYLGCDPIVFIGQDLSYTGDKHHSSKTISSFDKNIKLTAHLEVDGYYGDKVMTTSNFFTFLKWFEKRIERSNRRFINCTEGGVKIKGTEQIEFSKFVKNQNLNYIDDYNELLLKLEGNKIQLNKYDIGQGIENIKNIKKIIDKILSISDDLMNQSLKKNQINRTLHQLDRYDKKIIETVKIDFFLKFITSDLRIKFNNRKVSGNYSIGKNNQKFYEDLKEELEFLEEVFGEVHEK